jgi:predicted CxxxxCH...CXXCH cytochrome family protein
MNAVTFFVLAVALLATTGISWAAGGYQYNLTCSGCHGMPPLDDSTRNPVTGGFNGNHQTHMAPTVTQAQAKCDICHSGTTNPVAFVSGHSDGKIQMFSKYTKGTFFNQTSVPNLTNATCSNVNCHFEKLTPVWASAPLGANTTDCQVCHASPPNAGQTGTGHTSHTKYPQFGWVACDVCHTNANHLFEAKPFQHATSAGRNIVLSSAFKYTAALNDYLPSQTNVFGKCSNTYCHSNGSPTPATQGYATVAYKTYTSPVFGTTGNGCGICHAAAPTTNAHARHVGAIGYACVLCHSDTVDATNAIIVANGTHVNNVHNYQFSGVAGTGNTCSTSYCHAAQGGLPATAPVWTGQNTAACGTCHKATNATQNSFAHTAHLNSAVALYGPPVLQGAAVPTSCQVCHTTYVNNGATHSNGVVNTSLLSCNPCHVGTQTLTIWQGGRVTCESCHVGTTRSQIQGVTAPDQSTSAVTGHTQNTFTGAPQCTTCHDNTAAHISGVIGDAVRLKLANTNAQCASCHNAPASVIPAFRNMSTHFTTYKGPQNMLCKQCHDPHGTTNLSMIRTQLKGPWSNITTWTITYTDPVNGFINTANNRGLCQVCHTKTNHYRAGVPEGNNHHTSGCLGCHGHNAAGGAFKPAGGACDSCHGYPPLPKGLAGLTFGTAGNYANGRFEDYSGGGGAHFVNDHVKPTAVASEGWTNCAMCHNGGSLTSTPNHLMVTPVKTNIPNVTVKVDQKYQFAYGVQITYTSAKLTNTANKTGTCTNVECHFQPSKRWSVQR